MVVMTIPFVYRFLDGYDITFGERHPILQKNIPIVPHIRTYYRFDLVPCFRIFGRFEFGIYPCDEACGFEIRRIIILAEDRQESRSRDLTVFRRVETDHMIVSVYLADQLIPNLDCHDWTMAIVDKSLSIGQSLSKI